MRRISAVLMGPLMLLASASCGPQEGEVESIEAGLNIAYVSGHLGSEQACPALVQSLRREVCAEPCESDNGVPSPCYNGALMIRVRNIVDHAVPIRIERLELIQGSEKSEMIIREVATSEGRAISQVDENGEATIRILFPARESFGGSNVGKVRVIVSGENGEKLEILTPQLELVAAVVT